MRIIYSISNEFGCLGLLCPPGHPMHTHAIVGKDVRGELVSFESLESDGDHLPQTVKKAAADILHKWEMGYDDLSLTHPDVQDWIYQVLGYFHDCYTPTSGSRKVEDLVIDLDRDPMEYVDTHAGVLMIRDYYPEYMAAKEHFKRAYWGTKARGTKKDVAA